MNGPITVDGAYGSQLWNFGAAMLVANGSFGGGTLSAQICSTDSSNDADWIDTGTDDLRGQLTDQGTINIDIPKGFHVRVNMTGAGSPSVHWMIARRATPASD